MTGGPLTPTHPTRVCVDAVAGALDAYARSGVDPDWLGSEERAALLLDLTGAENRLAAFKARVLAGADGLAQRDGFKDPGAWLAAVTHTDVAGARAAYRLGVRMRHHAAVASALEAGRIGADHAAAVIASVRELKASGEVPADLLSDVEVRLVEHSDQFTPSEVRRLGRQALEVIDPDRADVILERLLDAEEKRAYARSRLSARDQGDGTLRINATVPTLPGQVFLAALDAFTNPARHTDDDGRPTADQEQERLTVAEKRGRAFIELLEHLPTDGLPVSGGTPVGIGVTLDIEKLRAGVGAARLDDGTLLSVGETRRLACRHGIYPLVLGGASVLLDLGRTRRLFSAGQTKAKRAVQPTCQARGCTVPSTWCHGHHRDPWSTGGRTDLDRLVLLCPHHHRRVHDTRYEHRWHIDQGRVTLTFHRRT